VQANIDYLELLKEKAKKAGLEFSMLEKIGIWPTTPIIFALNVDEQLKMKLMSRALFLTYTPSHEHFGIVPCEAMFAGIPVIGVNNGGLLETVTTDESNGILCPPHPQLFADAFLQLLHNPHLSAQMGQNGRRRVIEKFSLDFLSRSLHEKIISL
jgi:alpha-1,3/alpha-1,6-mannosyltransferase